jgi:hypothetical protein
MTLIRTLGQLRRPALFWSLASGTLLVAHDAVFLAQVGPGEGLTRALRSGGHGYWQVASVVLLAILLLAALAIAARLALLHRRARSLATRAAPPMAAPSRMRLGLRLWLRLFAIVAIGFAVQENVEHLAQHDHLMGLAALHGPEYPLALPVLALVSLVAAAVGAGVLGIEHQLLATLATVGPPAMRAPRSTSRPPLEHIVRRQSPLARRAAGRAPPTWFAIAPIA